MNKGLHFIWKEGIRLRFILLHKHCSHSRSVYSLCLIPARFLDLRLMSIFVIREDWRIGYTLCNHHCSNDMRAEDIWTKLTKKYIFKIAFAYFCPLVYPYVRHLQTPNWSESNLEGWFLMVLGPFCFSLSQIPLLFRLQMPLVLSLHRLWIQSWLSPTYFLLPNFSFFCEFSFVNNFKTQTHNSLCI